MTARTSLRGLRFLVENSANWTLGLIMTSNNNMEVKRSPHKTYSAFNALPTLRARDRRDSVDKSANRAFKRPPQMADQLLFPGRRLDRLQRSTYSGYSGRSLDIETIVSGGRINSNNNNTNAINDNGSVVSVSKPGSGISGGFSRSLNDVTNQPWDSIRQLPSAHSHLSLLSNHSKQNTPLSGTRPRGIAAQNAGGSASMGNLHADYSKNFNRTIAGSFPAASGRWQLSEPHRKQVYGVDRTIPSCSSPDSSYSSESVSEPQEPTPIPPPAIQLHRTLPVSQSGRGPNPFLKKQTSQSETIKESRTPQLDKILWALVPDEFANISDTGISEHGPGNTSPHYLTFTDLEMSEAGSSGDEGATSRHPSTRVPCTPRRPALTEETLSQYASSIPSDDRIQQWLVECDANMPSNKLPTHLPDINYTFKYSNKPKS